MADKGVTEQTLTFAEIQAVEALWSKFATARARKRKQVILKVEDLGKVEPALKKLISQFAL